MNMLKSIIDITNLSEGVSFVFRWSKMMKLSELQSAADQSADITITVQRLKSTDYALTDSKMRVVNYTVRVAVSQRKWDTKKSLHIPLKARTVQALERAILSARESRAEKNGQAAVKGTPAYRKK